MNTPLGEALVQSCCDSPVPLSASTAITETLTQKRRKLEGELAAVNAALAALERNPEVAEVLNLVGKAVRY